ncbi:unnamed protein product, partial [Effrenium voratum]
CQLNRSVEMGQVPAHATVDFWEYEHSQDQWCPFVAEHQLLLLCNYVQYNAGVADSSKLCLKLGRAEYDVDIEAMMQTNLKTQTQRPIRIKQLDVANFVATRLGTSAIAGLQALQPDMQTRDTELQLQALKSIERNLEMQVVSAKQHVSDLQAENEAQLGRIQLLTEESDVLKLQLQAADRQSPFLQSEEDNQQESQLRSAQQRISDLQVENDLQLGKINVLTQERDDLKLQLQSANQKATDLQKESTKALFVKSSNKEKNDVRVQLRNANQRSMALQSENEHSWRRIKSLVQEKDQMQSRLQSANQQVEDLQNEIGASHLQAEKLQADVKKQRLTNETLTSINHSLGSKLAEAESAACMVKQQLKVDDLKSQLAKAEARLTEARSLQPKLAGAETKLAEAHGKLAEAEAKYDAFSSTCLFSSWMMLILVQTPLTTWV